MDLLIQLDSENLVEDWGPADNAVVFKGFMGKLTEYGNKDRESQTSIKNLLISIITSPFQIHIY